MPKEKRKARLDKASGSAGTEFIGFSAFANTSSPPAAVVSPSSASDKKPTLSQQSSTVSTSSAATLWSPVYTGKDERFGTLFARIGQKRDATTVGRAVKDLHDLMQDNSIHKRIQAEALQHWAWLYHSKLHYDNNSSVRALSLQTWILASQRVPKVARNLIMVQPEVLGMLYSTLVDPSTEVRALAAEANQFFPPCQQSTEDGNGNDMDASSWPWQQGILDYVHRICSYGRASAMHDSLFAKKKESASDLNDDAKDHLEERYERIVVTALATMEHWIRNNFALEQEEEEDNSITSDVVSKWWKFLSNPKASLRRKTYNLLAAITSEAPTLLPQDDLLVKMMAQAISSEKEAINVPSLLETNLGLLARQRQPYSTDWSPLVKPLSKMLKKACYGAKVDQWGPMLLPLTVKLSDIVAESSKTQLEESSLVLLKAMYDGRDLTLGNIDKYSLLMAMAEVASFQLLRKHSSPTANLSSETAKSIATLWLQGFEDILNMPSKNGSSGPAENAKEKLLQQLAKELVKFQDATLNRPNCAFFVASEWFWNEGLDLSASDPATLAQWIEYVRLESIQSSCEKQDTGKDVLIFPQMRQRVLHVLSQFQTSSGAIPTESAYKLLLRAFEYCGPLQIFDQDNNDYANKSLQKFIMNDLLRWIVIHTSTLSTQVQTKWLVDQDFRLLHSCLLAIPEKRESLWESLLREIIAAKCNLGWLVSGVLQMLRLQNGEDLEWFKCVTFDNFATETAAHWNGSKEPIPSGTQVDTDLESIGSEYLSGDDYTEKLEFFKLCLGLGVSSGFSGLLIKRNVLTDWIAKHYHSEWDSMEQDPVLEALLLLIKSDCSLLDNSDKVSILIEAWRQRGQLHEIYGPALMKTDYSLRDSFLEESRKILLGDLEKFFEGDLESKMNSSVTGWSARAWRVLEICRICGGPDPSLSFVGLGDSERWNRLPDVSFILCMRIFHYVDNKADRLALLQKSLEAADAIRLTVEILLSLSDGRGDVLMSVRAKKRRDRCSEFLEAIGGSSLDSQFLEQLFRYTVLDLCRKLEEEQSSETKVCCAIAVMSQLLDLMFLRVIPTGVTEIAAEDVVEGSYLWYISDPKKPKQRQHVEIAKIHYDVQAGYYFTIRFQRNGETQERQTIVGRLSRGSGSEMEDEGILADNITEDEWSKRSEIRDFLMKNLLEPYFSPELCFWPLGEVINIIVLQVGIGSDRGLGSPHYEIYRRLSSLEEQVRSDLSKDDMVAVTNGSWSLAIALGLGLNAPTSAWTIGQIRIDATKLCKDLVDFYSDDRAGLNLELDCSILAWLIISIPSLLNGNNEKNEVLLKSLTMLFDISCKIFQNEVASDFLGSTLLACRAVYEGVVLLANRLKYLSDSGEAFVSDLLNSKADALFQLIRSFSTGWCPAGNHVGDSQKVSTENAWLLFSEFPDLIRRSREDQAIRESLAVASARKNTSLLASALNDAAKRNSAFLLLDAVAALGNPLQSSEGEVELSAETLSRLRDWTAGIEDDEAAEIEADVYIVAEWIPTSMMNEIEGWSRFDIPVSDETIVFGRLLTWIAFLQLADSAAPKDFSIRPAFVSYLGKCCAISSILNMALLNDENINFKKRDIIPAPLDIDELFLDEESITISKVASLALFRTVEVFPSLSRRWWEEDCPKVYTSRVQTFVEKHVAPEILKRELGRIKAATTFGPMNVTASLVSREVTATYIQDDFTLTVMIALPTAFPFRSAEVDCSKTLGVPQSRWKRWSLQITMMLNNQGGTLQDALMLWKDNVDKEFEGVEPCPVCYSVLHVKTHKLPTLECKTCHNRFHMDCLTQWFRSSGKNQCVLCQQPWAGTRIQ